MVENSEEGAGWKPGEKASGNLLPRQEGLLAFLYDVYTTEVHATAFKKDPTAVMEAYRLTQEEIRAVWKTGLDPNHAANKPLLEQINAKATIKYPKRDELKDREVPDPHSMSELCQLLVKHLCQKEPFDYTW
jgi:hypothetical protein